MTVTRAVWPAVLLLAAAPVVVAGDWKGDLAKKAVGHAVREGLEDAAKDAALDAALDAVADVVVPEASAYVASRLGDIDDYVEIGEAVGDGVEFSMRAADVADKLDDVADVAKAAKRLSKLGKLKR